MLDDARDETHNACEQRYSNSISAALRLYTSPVRQPVPLWSGILSPQQIEEVELQDAFFRPDRPTNEACCALASVSQHFRTVKICRKW